MADEPRVAVLIDADNVPASKVGAVAIARMSPVVGSITTTVPLSARDA